MNKKPEDMTQEEVDAELRTLQQLQSVNSARRAQLRTEIYPLQKEYDELGREQHRMGGRISALKHNGRKVPLVTDHAIVRYLERVEGIDTDAIRHKIIGHPGARQKGDVVITILDEKGKE